MSITRSIVVYLFAIYLITGIMIVGIANIIPIEKNSVGQQKIVTVPTAFKPIEFVLDNFF